MGKLRGVLFVLSGGIATIVVAVAWVSLRWLERGQAEASNSMPSQRPSLVGSPDPWMA